MTDLDNHVRTASPPLSTTVSPASSGPASSGPASSGNENMVDLLRELVGQGAHLADQQIALMKAEVREASTDLKVAIGGMVGAAVVGIAGLGVLLMALAYLLAEQIDNLGLATLIVGVATLVVAFILYKSAASKMSATHLAPERTQRTLQRTSDAVRGEL